MENSTENTEQKITINELKKRTIKKAIKVIFNQCSICY